MPSRISRTRSRSDPRRPRPAGASGFTLVELMVVIVIIGLLATVVVLNVLPSQDRAMSEKARADISLLEQALETYPWNCSPIRTRNRACKHSSASHPG